MLQKQNSDLRLESGVYSNHCYDGICFFGQGRGTHQLSRLMM